MLDLKTYISLVLKKKNITYDELCRRMNMIKYKLGDKGIVRKPNISEMLNASRSVDERTLLIMEKALELPMDSLVKLSKGTTLPTKRQNNALREVLKGYDIRF